jgi:hypothetical protein
LGDVFLFFGFDIFGLELCFEELDFLFGDFLFYFDDLNCCIVFVD